MTTPLFYWSVLVIAGLYILVRGGGPERIGIMILAIGSVATSAMADTDLARRFRSVEEGMFIVDLAVLAAYLLLAAQADRFWPIWVTGFQIAGVAPHAARLIAPGADPWAYAVALGLWGYLMLAAIVIGAWRYRRRLKTNSVSLQTSSV